MTYPFNI